MGDHDKQVSWLAAWSPNITVPDLVVQWYSMWAHRLQLRGQPGH